jgi:2-amino-4-hydroxy-6-hydroxymethyldihydropteridine diphosphokinase
MATIGRCISAMVRAGDVRGRGERYRALMRVYLGLGANLGDAAATMAWGVARIGEIPGLRVRAVSPLYATAPWGVTEQPEFRNAALAADLRLRREVAPAAAALALLTELKTIEREAGRRSGRRWGPRELDIDLLVVGRHTIRVERPPETRSLDAASDPARAARLLEVPHRDLGERLFVLAPLADLAPRLVPPGWHETVETRRRAVAATEGAGAVRKVGDWDQAAGAWEVAT